MSEWASPAVLGLGAGVVCVMHKIESGGQNTAMAVPKRKTSRARKGKRRSHMQLVVSGVPRTQKVRAPGRRSSRFFCENCNQPKPPHAVCPNCGHYRGRALIEVER